MPATSTSWAPTSRALLLAGGDEIHGRVDRVNHDAAEAARHEVAAGDEAEGSPRGIRAHEIGIECGEGVATRLAGEPARRVEAGTDGRVDEVAQVGVVLCPQVRIEKPDEVAGR